MDTANVAVYDFLCWNLLYSCVDSTDTLASCQVIITVFLRLRYKLLYHFSKRPFSVGHQVYDLKLLTPATSQMGC